MPAKKGPAIGPVFGSRPRRETINLYLAAEEVERINAIAARLGGTRSDALRYLLTLDWAATEKNPRKKS